jgi:hypothetical protein
MVKAQIFGQMVKSLLVTGKRTKGMEMEQIRGKMAISMWVNSKMTLSMVKAH